MILIVLHNLYTNIQTCIILLPQIEDLDSYLLSSIVLITECSLHQLILLSYLMINPMPCNEDLTEKKIIEPKGRPAKTFDDRICSLSLP